VYRVADLDRNKKLLTTYSTLFSPPSHAQRPLCTNLTTKQTHEISLARSSSLASHPFFKISDPDSIRVVEGRGPRMCQVQMDLPTKFLTKQRTSVGRSLAKRWLAHPVCDAPTIQARLTRVEHYVLRPEERERIAKCLRDLPVQKKGAYGRCLRMLNIAFAAGADAVSGLPPLAAYHTHLKRTVNSDGKFLPRADVTLKKNYDAMEIIRGRAEILVKQHKGTLVEIDHQFFCRQSKRYCTRRHIKRSRKNDVTFEMAELNVLNVQMENEWTQYQHRCEQMRENLRLVSEPFLSALDKVNAKLAELDVYTSWAKVATGAKWVKPTMSPSIKLIGVTHPWTTVPNDLVMNKGEHRVITGYIASGKSTTMRTLAMAVFLHQVGMYVPARSAALPLFTGLYGVFHTLDRRGGSTFTEHLRVIKGIRERCERDGLVLLDELCNGTNVEEGFVVAKGVLDQFVGTTVMVTTHLRGMGRPRERWHMTEGYCLRPGECDERRALDYCRRIGLI